MSSIMPHAPSSRPPLRPSRSLPLILSPDVSNSSASLSSQNTTLGSRQGPAAVKRVDEHENDAGEPLMAHHERPLNALPWIKAPVKGSEEIWVRAKDEAPEWLPLLFDLVVVAVMTTFSLVRLSSSHIIPTLIISNIQCLRQATFRYSSHSSSLCFGPGSAKPPMMCGIRRMMC